MTDATPGTEDELAALVRDASVRGEALVLEGGGTKRAFGPAPPRDVRVVSLARLAGIVAHDPADMILSVEPGARLADVQRALAVHDQWLPLDPPFAGATIGGVLATNSSGPRRAGYGTVKDHLLGLRVVGAAGQATKSGGRVVKNVSGYDLHRLQVGAFGALGVISLAHFKVSPRPEVSAMWLRPCASVGDAHRLLLAVSATALRPVALEALDATAAMPLREVLGLGAPTAIAVVGLEGSRASFERHARDLATFAGRGGAGRPGFVVEPTAVDALWESLRELPSRHAEHVRVRVGARPHELPDLLAALEHVRVVGVTVRAAAGVAHVSLAPAGDAAPLAEIVTRWHRLAAARGGYAVVESAPLGVPNRAALPFGTGAPTSGPAAALRRAWDPKGTLNPGRVPW